MDHQWNAPLTMVIIDFQALLDSNHGYIIKELCVAPVSIAAENRETGIQFWTFKTPRPFRHYSNENKYVTGRYHGMSFDFGDIPYTCLLPILEKTVHNYDYLFVKGLEKSVYLRTLLNRPVYDLNAFNCARNFSSSLSCIFHCGTTFKCAVRNCISNRNWFVQFLRKEILRGRLIKNCESDLSINEPLTRWETTFTNWDLREYCTQRVDSFTSSSSENKEGVVKFFHDLLLGNQNV